MVLFSCHEIVADIAFLRDPEDDASVASTAHGTRSPNLTISK